MGKRVVAGLLLLVAFVTITTFMHPNVSTVAAAGDIPDCAPVAKAGEMVVYRCEDYEMDIVCYSQGLMLFCLQN